MSMWWLSRLTLTWDKIMNAKVQVALGRTRLSAMTMIEKWRGSGREKNWENP